MNMVFATHMNSIYLMQLSVQQRRSEHNVARTHTRGIKKVCLYMFIIRQAGQERNDQTCMEHEAAQDQSRSARMMSARRERESATSSCVCLCVCVCVCYYMRVCEFESRCRFGFQSGFLALNIKR